MQASRCNGFCFDGAFQTLGGIVAVVHGAVVAIPGAVLVGLFRGGGTQPRFKWQEPRPTWSVVPSVNGFVVRF